VDESDSVRSAAAGMGPRSTSPGADPTLSSPPRIRADSDGYPIDSAFPELPVATDCGQMLGVFREHLEPLAGKAIEIRSCRPFRFRCHQSDSRSVLQYTLHVADRATGREWDQWVTGLLYAENAKAEQLWKELQDEDPSGEIPERWRSFRPIAFVPDLRMIVEVFPYDRKLRNLRRVMGMERGLLESVARERLGPGSWYLDFPTIRPTRYRTELGATLRYTVRARELKSNRLETVRLYLKVYRERNQRGAETFQTLRAIRDKVRRSPAAYSVVEPIAYLKDVRTLILAEAPGQSLTHFLRRVSDPADAMRRVARALAEFNQDDLPFSRSLSLADRLSLVRRSSDLLEWACPERKATVQSLAEKVLRESEEVPSSPIHGDMKPDHVFLDDDSITFIDFDSIVLGDPLYDPSHLFAYLVGGARTESYRKSVEGRAAETFVKEYFRLVPAAWEPRFPIAAAGALLEVGCSIFRRHEPGWREQLRRVVGYGEEVLSEGGL